MQQGLTYNAISALMPANILRLPDQPSLTSQEQFQYLSLYQPYNRGLDIGYTNFIPRKVFSGTTNWWITFTNFLRSLPNNLELAPIGHLITDYYTLISGTAATAGAVVMGKPNGLDQLVWTDFCNIIPTLAGRLLTPGTLSWTAPPPPPPRPNQRLHIAPIKGPITPVPSKKVPKTAQYAVNALLSPNQKQAPTQWFDGKNVDFIALLDAYFYHQLTLSGQNAAYFPYAIRLHPGQINFSTNEQTHIVQTFYNGNLQQFLADNQ